MAKDKIYRILHLYSKLVEGDIIDKDEAAEEYGVNVRSIHRDLADIRKFVEGDTLFTDRFNTIILDRKKGGYRLRNPIFRRFEQDEDIVSGRLSPDMWKKRRK